MDKNVYEFISTQTGEDIVERKTCDFCGKEFAIFDKDIEFYDKMSPTINGKKYKIPTPIHCPECRFRQILAFFNEQTLYKRKCDLTGNAVVGIYSSNKPYKVYEQNAWFGDQNKTSDIYQNFEFSRTFFEQFKELMYTVPHCNFKNQNSENSDYCIGVSLKDCYLMFIGITNERCYYGERISDCLDSLDCADSRGLQHCYGCVSCIDCYQSKFLFDSVNCKYCNFSHDLINCEECLFCHNLANAKYCIDNIQYTPSTYLQTKQQYEVEGKFSKMQFLQKKLDLVKKNSTKKALNLLNAENCFGNNLKNSKDLLYVFSADGSENCRYSRMNNFDKDCFDSDCYQSELCLNVHYGKSMFNSIFSIPLFENCRNAMYSYACINCSDIFGCVGLKNKQYCVLNKQYTKLQYEILVSKIIEYMQDNGERGLFFPTNLSPFGYNETVANEYFPLSKEQAVSLGYNREDNEYPINIPEGIETIYSQDLPDDIKNADDSILDKAIICQKSGKPFRIVKGELEFYRKHELPLPRLHWNERRLKRLPQRPGLDLYLRECDKCGKQVISVYPPDSEFRVYCEYCYNKKFY